MKLEARILEHMNAYCWSLSFSASDIALALDMQNVTGGHVKCRDELKRLAREGIIEQRDIPDDNGKIVPYFNLPN